MNGCVGLGTNNLELAASFYEQLLGQIGITREQDVPASPAENRAVYFASKSGIELIVVTPWDGKPATVGNGTMVALKVDSHEKIDALHALAIKLGGTDEGAPGPRGPGSFYAGYFRDLDGNKLTFFTD
jgi:catechol 2,3-dioxygenase-like lactoylglutathione lyase family enzyme